MRRAMRRLWTTQAPTFAALCVMVLIFLVFAAVIGPDLSAPPRSMPAIAATPIGLPAPGQDADGDTWADDVDLWDGDLVVALEVSRVSLSGGDRVRPYLLVGTQDDQWRTGRDAELEWRRVVDHDAMGHQPGSPQWIDAALRTGTWWRSLPMQGHTHAMAEGALIESEQEGAHWPQTFHVNVRDDRPGVRVQIEAWDSDTRPHEELGAWTVEVDVVEGRWRFAGGPWRPAGESAATPGLDMGRSGLEASLELQSAIDPETRQRLAEKWAPLLHFHDGERFFPTRGDALEQFHGFSHREEDHRTWERGFNNARDGYRLLLADFTGDGDTTHEDAAVLYDVLRAGPVGTDTVYANVVRTTGDHVVVQYWFVYMYNFILDETGRDIIRFAHAGDREFMQLVFEDLDAAEDGDPLRTAYSQHYKGVRSPFAPGQPPFHLDAQHPAVFVAQGTHASYPAEGTDAALRNSLQGYGDVFFGDGEQWPPEDYDIELLGTQTWHAGYLWGPLTRHSRDMGTAVRPLLQHDFAYPFTDPLHWETNLRVIEADRLAELYGGAD